MANLRYSPPTMLLLSCIPDISQPNNNFNTHSCSYIYTIYIYKDIYLKIPARDPKQRGGAKGYGTIIVMVMMKMMMRRMMMRMMMMMMMMIWMLTRRRRRTT